MARTLPMPALWQSLCHLEVAHKTSLALLLQQMRRGGADRGGKCPGQPQTRRGAGGSDLRAMRQSNRGSTKHKALLLIDVPQRGDTGAAATLRDIDPTMTALVRFSACSLCLDTLPGHERGIRGSESRVSRADRNNLAASFDRSRHDQIFRARSPQSPVSRDLGGSGSPCATARIRSRS